MWEQVIGNLALVVCIPILIDFCTVIQSCYDIHCSNRFFKISYHWTKFHEKLSFLKDVFLKNGYPLWFIDKCFKLVINKLVIKRPQIRRAGKKTLILSLPYLGDISLQKKTKLRNSFRGFWIVASLKLFSNVKKNSLMTVDSKIAYFLS